MYGVYRQSKFEKARLARFLPNDLSISTEIENERTMPHETNDVD